MVVDSMYRLGTKRSCIRELFEYGLGRAEIVGKENVYDYSIGNPSVPAPGEVKTAFLRQIEREDSLAVHGYTPAPGALSARKAITDNLNSRYGSDLKPQNIFLTCGAAPALILAIRALAVPESEFIVLAPFFPEYVPFIANNGGKPVIVPADVPAFGLRADVIEGYVTEHTQAIIVNSPNNPSGVVYSKESLKALAEVLSRKSAEYGHPIYLISDEPYREIVYDGVEVPFIPDIYKDTIICYSYSKSLSLPGERIGYVLVPDRVTDSADVFASVAGAARIIGHVCAPSIQQMVAAECCGVGPDNEAYDRNRKLLYKELTAMGYECVYPAGAFYMLVRVPGFCAKDFSDTAKKYDLLVVPCDDFGCPEFARLSTCVANDMIVRSLPTFKKVIEEMKG